MAPFRPSNLNTRLVSSTGGNAGVVGPRTCPFSPIPLGGRCDNLAGKGRFNISESYCSAKTPPTDCKGFLICCGPSTTKWFVSPQCTEVSRTWHLRNDAITVANSCMGACGWFIPDIGQSSNPGYVCRTYWDSYCLASYHPNTQDPNFPANACIFNMANGGAGGDSYKNTTACVRAFRCTPT